MNRSLHSGRGRKQPLAEALTGSAIDKNPIMSRNRNLKHALIMEKLVQRTGSDKLGHCLFCQTFRV